MALKGILSLYIVYHLIAVFMLPNHQSLLNRMYSFLFTPYANTLNMNTPWMFFSPNPSLNQFIYYELMDERGDWLEEGKAYQWPPEKHLAEAQWNYDRLVYNSYFVSMKREKIIENLIPYLCRKHPKAYGVYIRKVAEQIPNIEKAHLLNKKFEKMRKEIELPVQEFQCPDKTVERMSELEGDEEFSGGDE